jgi:hypothetical protein
MQTEAGRKIYECIRAVCRMHSATSRLLQDFDKHAAWPSISVFQGTATKDLTYATSAAYWMPEGVFRYLSCKDNPRLVEAITVCFLDDQIDEPILLLGRLEYAEDPIKTRAMCDGWDLWYMHFPLRSGWEHGVAARCDVPADREARIKKAALVSVPLYTITRIADLKGLLDNVRVAFSTDSARSGLEARASLAIGSDMDSERP